MKLMDILESIKLPVVRKSLHESVYQLKKSGMSKQKGGTNDEEVVNVIFYDILLNGVVVGELEYESYFGSIHGQINGKPITISGHGSDVKTRFDAFLKSRDGKKLPVIRKSLREGVFDTTTAEEMADKLNKGIKAPYIHAQVSRLGGPKNVSILIVLSVQEPKYWRNGILENSDYIRLHLYNNGKLKQFSGSIHGYKPMRQTTVRDINDAISKINKYVNTAFMHIPPEKLVKDGMDDRAAGYNEDINNRTKYAKGSI